jgi:ATP-dependent Clp protease ATP-binding subunit ClpA
MTQEGLDALLNSDNLNEIIENYHEDEENHSVSMIKQLNSVTTDSEEKVTQTTQKLEQIINEVNATKQCINSNEIEKANIILNDVENMLFDVISFMQYQDIHRQKIERVINKIIEMSDLSDEELAKLSLNIACSAKYIDGDNKQILDNEDIDKLINQIK